VITIDLIKNIALLVALAAIYPVLTARLDKSVFSKQVLFGAMFGTVGVLGMMTPIDYGDGVIFDGRSIILAVAGLIGGPLVGAISATMMTAYRAMLGGAGLPVGVMTILASVGIGLLFHYLRKRSANFLGPLTLLGFGFLVHAVMLGLFLFLPNDMGHKVINDLGLTIMLFYPLATMLISLLFQDYEERERNRSHIEHLAFYDSLTQLPNRSFLIERLTKLMSDCAGNQAKGALILLNLDRFKTLNDARGHASGDLLLRAVAEQIRTVMDKKDLLARMSADEFAILLHRYAIDAESIDELTHELVDKIQQVLKYPLRVDFDDIIVSSSIGMTSFSLNPQDKAGDVLRRVDTAMHRAKKSGGNQRMVFDSSMFKLVEQRFLIEREMSHAIRNHELRLFAQSQVNHAGVVVGAETLVRWQHPQQGLISPQAFIPIAEESELIIDIGKWVLSEACKLLTSEKLTVCPITISVNISPKHFRQSDFVATIKAVLADTGANSNQLILEVTESLLIDNISDVIAKMIELTGLGIRFSLDDFGTGYSSLAYLKRLPIHELKIDKSFVQDAPTDADDAALVESILAVAEHMNLKVVAEGVETQEQADFLNARHEVIHQGYLFSKPELAESWLKKLP
jgi:diguanylate cyclase (GGDEF)-like protein